VPRITEPIQLELLADFFNRIGQNRPIHYVRNESAMPPTATISLHCGQLLSSLHHKLQANLLMNDSKKEKTWPS
jgi:hypothetical protein